MKIGITIPGYYEQYLDKIANLNGCSLTRVCSLIVENFLSYNLNLKKFPLFRKDVRIIFANEVSKSGINSDSGINGSSSPCSDCEQLETEQSNLSREEILAQLESFDYEPED